MLIRLLHDRNLRVLLAGQALNMFGNSAMILTLSIWVVTLTGSPGAAGLVFVFLVLPTMAAPFLGLLVDLFPRRRVLIVNDLASAVLVATLVTVHDRGDVWLIYLVALGYGVSGQIYRAARGGLLHSMVPSELLGDVNGVFSSLNQGLRIVGPLAGAGIFAAAGGTVVALLDTATFLLSAASYLLLRTVPDLPPTRRPPTPTPDSEDVTLPRLERGNSTSSPVGQPAPNHDDAASPRLERDNATSSGSSAGAGSSTGSSTNSDAGSSAGSGPGAGAGPRPSSGRRGRAAGQLVDDLLAGARHVLGTPVLRRIVFASAIAFGAAGSVNVAIYALIGDGLGRPPEFIGVLGAVQGAGSIVAGFLVGPLMRRAGELTAAGLGFVLNCAGLLAISTASLPGVVTGALVAGLGLPMVLVAEITLVQRRTAAELQGRTIAAADAIIDIPYAAGIGVAGLIIGTVGYRPVYLVDAAVFALVGLAVLRARALTRPAPPQPAPADVPS
jgi:MFS family permease